MFTPGETVVVLISPTSKAVGEVTYRWFINGRDLVYTVRVEETLQVFFADDVASVPRVRQ